MVPAHGHLRREFPRPTAEVIVGNQAELGAVEGVAGAEAVDHVDLGADRIGVRSGDDELLLHGHVIGEVVVAVAADHVQPEGFPAAGVAARGAAAACIAAFRAAAAGFPATQVVAEVEAGRLEVVRGRGDNPAGKLPGEGHPLGGLTGVGRVGVGERPRQQRKAVGEAVLEARRLLSQVEVISFDSPVMAAVQPHAHGEVDAGAGAVFGRIAAEEHRGAGHQGPALRRPAGGHQRRQVGPLAPPQKIVGLKPESPRRATKRVAAGQDALTIIGSRRVIADVRSAGALPAPRSEVL